MKILLRLLGITRGYRNWMLLSVLLGFLTIGSSVGLMMTAAFIIAKAALHPSIAELQVAIVGVRFFGISRGVFRYLERIVSHETTFRLLARFRVWFYQALEPLAPARLMQYRSGDLLTRIVSDIESLEHVFIRVLSPPVVALLITGLMWLLFGMFNLVFAVWLTAAMLVAGIGVPLLTHFLSREPGRRLIAVRADLNNLSIDGLQGLPELLLFGQAEDHLREFDRTNRQHENLKKQLNLIEGLHEALIGLLMNLTVLALLYAAIPFVENNLLDGVYLSVIVLGCMSAFEAVSGLPDAARQWEGSRQAARRLFEIVDAPPAVRAPDRPLPPPRRYSLHISDLTFRYPGNETPALLELNLELPENEVIAVVGSSGAGKSTIANLLLRFWDYTEGSIKIGGRELKTMTPEDARGLFGVVTQSTHLFAGTIRENLRIAQPGAGDAQLAEAARLAEIHDFIMSLPDGYDTYLGEWGLNLSGGERQRLAIARAILKNAPLMIYDEPTANLDALSERKILQTIWNLSRRRTTLMITHRLTELEKANRIIVLREGKMVEQGRHRELISRDTFYRHLWRQQRQTQLLETSVSP